jgi:methionyl-tRNA synthetase
VPSRLVVISPAPTANGDLHLGHLAGPFLAADVHTRYARATGREVLFGTGAQDTSTFVVTTARRLGAAPRSLALRSAREIEATLAAIGIEVDGFTGFDDRFTKHVLAFLDRLHSAGRLVLRTVRFPFLPSTGEFLVDGHVRGGCPVCLAEGCAGLCEGCGHPVAAAELLDPRSSRHPDEPVQWREAEVLVLPLEDYRDRLREYFGGPAGRMRPRMAQIVGELLSGPLPDFPITYPVAWGLPAPFPEVAGQVVNPNAECMAWSMHATTRAAEGRGDTVSEEDELWRPEAGSSVVYFLGSDNTHPFAVAGPAMLLACEGRYALPDRFVTNEFYELDDEKFSTSRGHVVGGGELAAEVPRDLIRFHLATTSPEYQRTSFGRAALGRVTGDRLVRPWNAIAAAIEPWADHGPLPVSGRGHAAAARMAERFRSCYELDGFSLGRAAGTIAEQLARLAGRTPTTADAGDFGHEVDTLLRCAAPILIDLAAAALPDTAFPAGQRPGRITPRRLPRLAESVV